MGCHALTAAALQSRRPGGAADQGVLSSWASARLAIDDRDGNAVLAALSVVACNMLHVIRTTTLSGRWRTAQPDTLRTLARLRSWPNAAPTRGSATCVSLKTEPLRARFPARAAPARGPLTTAHADLGAVDLIRLPSPCPPPAAQGSIPHPRDRRQPPPLPLHPCLRPSIAARECS